MVTQPTQADLARDRRVATRASEVARTHGKERKLGALLRQEYTSPEGTRSDSGPVLQTAPATGFGTPLDVVPQTTALRTTSQWKDDDDYDARRLRGAPA